MELWANQKNGYENKIWRSFDWNFFFLSTSFKRMQNAIHQPGGKKLSILHEMCYQASLSDSLHLSR